MSTFLFAQASTFSIKLAGYTPNVFSSNNVTLSDSMLSMFIDYTDGYVASDEFKKEDIEAIGQWIKGAQFYFLQSFENNDHVIDNRLHAVRKEILEDYKNILLQYVDHVEIRGIE